MKFLNCTKCHAIIQIGFERVECKCKQSAARYLSDGLYVDYSGPARILGVSNFDYRDTLDCTPTLDHHGLAELRFDMFVIPELERCHVRKRDSVSHPEPDSD